MPPVSEILLLIEQKWLLVSERLHLMSMPLVSTLLMSKRLLLGACAS